MLKLIPREMPLKNCQKGQKQNKKTQKQLKQGFSLGNDFKVEKLLVHNVCANLINYVKKAEVYSINQIGELIDGLRRSILSLERRRVKLLRQKKYKR